MLNLTWNKQDNHKIDPYHRALSVVMGKACEKILNNLSKITNIRKEMYFLLNQSSKKGVNNKHTINRYSWINKSWILKFNKIFLKQVIIVICTLKILFQTYQKILPIWNLKNVFQTFKNLLLKILKNLLITFKILIQRNLVLFQN